MNNPASLQSELKNLAQSVRNAARPLARATAAQRTRALQAMAEALLKNRAFVEAESKADVERGKAAGLSLALVDRLDITGKRFMGLVEAVRGIAALEDPLGQVSQSWTRPNGLEVRKVRLPLGVILMIYEARPNVTLDAAALCVRSGNAVILRGGSEARATNQALMQVIEEGLAQAELPVGCVKLVPTQEREAIDLLVQMDELIDLVIPRGGEALIRRVAQQSRIPVIKHYRGVCHVYVDKDANLEMAQSIIHNAKTHRPGVCNATETLLVHKDIAQALLPRVAQHLAQVELRGCAQTRAILPDVKAATPEDWDTEFLDLILAVRVVEDLSAAIDHIDQHGTQHTASIVTANTAAQERFLREVDASCVLVNASTRFNDGGELGLGAEMGISTTRVHAFGPMGVRELCAEKYVVFGQGQVRE